MLLHVPIYVNGVLVTVDFLVLAISKSKDGYPLILDRPWLEEV